MSEALLNLLITHHTSTYSSAADQAISCLENVKQTDCVDKKENRTSAMSKTTSKCVPQALSHTACIFQHVEGEQKQTQLLNFFSYFL